MSEAFDKFDKVDRSSISPIARRLARRTSVGGESYASGGARAGEDDGGPAQPGSQPVDSAGGLLVASGDHLYRGLERFGCI